MNITNDQIVEVNTISNEQLHNSPTEPTVQQTNDIENFSNVCRTCTNVTEFVIPIFVDEGLQNNLADKIHKHLPIKVSEEDPLPHVMCYQCASTLLAWHDLIDCCVQADTILRQRIFTSKEQSNTNACSNQSIEPEETSNTKVGVNPEPIVHELSNSSHSDDASGPAETTTKICHYCGTEQPENLFKEHLISTHSELLFHCDECDSYVDRKEFIIHMSEHAVEYTSKGNVIEHDTTEINENDTQRTEVNDLEFQDTVQNSEKTQNDSEITEYIQAGTAYGKTTEKGTEIQINRNENQTITQTEKALENDFSDHSDAEYFCELPKSVFEAIEDSQDTQSGDGVEQELQNRTIESNGDVNKGDEEYNVKEATSERREVNEKVEKKARTCPICSKVYTANSSYFYHLKHSHKADKDHECDVCGKKFMAKPTLAQHLLIHAEGYSYKCQECGKKFRTRASLYIHGQIHSGRKKFSCAKCNKSFRWRAHLERHHKRHEGRKTFTCETCDRGFSVHSDLLRHMSIHSAGVFSCELCGIKFAQSRYLKAHIIKKHPS